MNRRYQGYLVDLDGTLFRGDRVIPAGVAFVNRLLKEDLSLAYLTNNSTRSPEEVANKLSQFGYSAVPGQVVTSSLATAQTLLTTFGSAPSVYVVGERGLRQALDEVGCIINEEDPEAVVVGLDRNFTYDKMKKAVLALHKGARLFGTNADRMLPTAQGMWPGSGSLCTSIAFAAGVKPTWIGKPELPLVEEAVRRLGLCSSQVLIVGDNLHTDIQAGVNSEIDTLLVTTGVTSYEAYQDSPINATYVVDSLGEWGFL